MRRRRLWLSSLAWLWLAVLTAPAASGETVYVSDRFEIGVHESTNIDSVILAVIPSGTSLDVIERQGEFVRVNTPTGIKGWVDARYVVAEKPTVALLEERDRKIAETTRSLGDARAEVEVLRQRVSELQRDAATAAQGSTDIAKPIALVSSEDSVKLKDAQHALEKLTGENHKLRARVADLQAQQEASQKSLAATTEKVREASAGSILRAPASAEMRSWTPWQWLLLGSIVLLAFAAGGYVVDWESRRRHGGFRV